MIPSTVRYGSLPGVGEYPSAGAPGNATQSRAPVSPSNNHTSKFAGMQMYPGGSPGEMQYGPALSLNTGAAGTPGVRGGNVMSGRFALSLPTNSSHPKSGLGSGLGGIAPGPAAHMLM